MIESLTDEMRRHIYSARDFSIPKSDKVFSETYDVCIVGSGAGGSITAATLARAGLKVILIERGPFVPPEEFNFRVLDMANRTGHLELTSGYRAILQQGNGLGGGTLIYGAVAMKPSDAVFDEWQEISGVSTINRESLTPHYRHIAEVMSITPQSKDLENRPNAIIREMAVALGKPDGLELVSRYTEGCNGAGMCNLGCGFSLKGTMLNSFLPRALGTGNVTILAEAQVAGLGGDSVNGGFRATGVSVVLRDFASGQLIRREFIKAHKVVIAAGAFFSSSLILSNKAIPGREKIGAKIFLQPHAQIFALFDEPVTKRGEMSGDQYIPFHGVPAIYNFTGFMREHRFFWLASVLFPANLASFMTHLPPDEHYQIMRRFHDTMSITLTLRDNPARSRVGSKDGRPQLDFKESRQDIENLRQCFLLAARGLLSVGARKVFLPLMRPPRIERESDLKKIEQLDFGYDDLFIYSDHTSGGNAIGVDAKHGVTDMSGRVFGTENLYVADSSLFPNSPGINPSWTIMALAHRIASGIAATN